MQKCLHHTQVITFCLLRCRRIKQSSDYDCVLLLGTVRGTAVYNFSSQHWWSILTELLRHEFCRFWCIAVGMGQHWTLFKRDIWACNDSNNEEFYLVRCDKVHFDGQVRTFRGSVGLHVHGRREDGCICEAFVHIYQLHGVTTRTHLRNIDSYWQLTRRIIPEAPAKYVRPGRTIFVSKYYT